MKLLCLFSTGMPELQKKQISRSFKQQAVVVIERSVDDFQGLDAHQDIIIVLCGLHDHETNIVHEIRGHFPKTAFLVMGLLSRDSRIEVLREGADFYLDQETAIAEAFQILLSIQSLSVSENIDNHVQIRDLRVSLQSYDAWRQDRRLSLTQKEYQLLRHLALHPGRTKSKHELLYEIWSDEPQINENSLEVLVHRLRRKLDPSEKDTMIHTMYGIGYRLA